MKFDGKLQSLIPTRLWTARLTTSRLRPTRLWAMSLKRQLACAPSRLCVISLMCHLACAPTRLWVISLVVISLTCHLAYEPTRLWPSRLSFLTDVDKISSNHASSSSLSSPLDSFILTDGISTDAAYVTGVYISLNGSLRLSYISIDDTHP